MWQGRFYSATLDEPHTWAALRYIECNPLRARLVRKPWRYAWSSAAAHVGEGPDASGLRYLVAWAADWTPARWRAQLAKPLTDAEIARLRRCVRTGRPLATDKWLVKLERKLGRRVRPRPVGRPKVKTEEK